MEEANLWILIPQHQKQVICCSLKGHCQIILPGRDWSKLPEEAVSYEWYICSERKEFGIIFSNEPIVPASMLPGLLPGMEIAGTSSWVHVISCYIISILERSGILGSCDIQQTLVRVLELQLRKGDEVADRSHPSEVSALHRIKTVAKILN